MATFKKLKSGNHQAQVYLGLPNQKFTSKTFPTEIQAKKWARQVEAARDRGERVATLPTVGAYYAEIEPGRRAVIATATAKKNEGHWRLHLEPFFAGLKLNEVRRSTVAGWVAQKVAAGVGVPTIEGSIRLLSAIFEQAVSDDLLVANPVRGVKVPRHSARKIRWIGPEEIDAVVAELNAPYDLLVDLAAHTGLRWGEIAGLRADAVDTRRGTIEVRTVLERDAKDDRGKIREYPKNDASARTVSIPKRLQQRVREAVVAADGLLFTGPHGGALSDRNVNRRHLAPACRRAGVEVFSFHATRHAHISWLVADGVGLLEIAKHVGHTSTRMIEQVYGHLRPGVHDRVAEAIERARTTIVRP